MNKLTSTLAGLALAAAASVAPAFAQGNLFSPPGGFTFTSTGSTITASSASVGFNPIGSTVATTASFNLTGTLVSGVLYNVTLLSFTPLGGSLFTETNPLQFTVVSLPTGGVTLASVGAASDGTTFNLVNPVPEASTVVSFGALLALGGLAVLRRKSVKNAA